MANKTPTADSIFKEYDKAKQFNSQIQLEDTVRSNENFFIGKQWEGVQANGLPTPQFNFLKRVVLFQVASILSDNIRMQASPLSMAYNQRLVSQMAEVVTNEFERIFENIKMGNLLREYMRNAAVDGDGCLYTYWDPDAETGQEYKGAICTEVIENTRVHFGNPNEREVQRQPYILIESREMVDELKERAKDNGVSDVSAIKSDTVYNSGSSVSDMITDERCTVVLRLWKDRETGEIWGCEAVQGLIIRKPWNLKIRLYPLVWLNWDYIQDSYHGQALITGLIPNQIFINKIYALTEISLMLSAFPKTVYDKTRVSHWSNRVGEAIGVNGATDGVAQILAPAQISPQISQFIDSTISYTQTFLGATPAALGDTRPDNTSAIVALQRASSVPSEITKQNTYVSIEEMGRIYLEFMIANYGTRFVKAPKPDLDGIDIPMPQNTDIAISFDFSMLRDYPMTLKLDVGASSYWSEIASMQTLDNLLMNGHISIVQYLERMPSGYVTDKDGLIGELKAQQQASMMQMPSGQPQKEQDVNAFSEGPPEIPLTAGNSALQRKVTQGDKVVA